MSASASPELRSIAANTAVRAAAAVLVAVFALILLVTFGWLLFLGVSKIIAAAMLVFVIVALFRKQWKVAMGLAALAGVLLVFDPFGLSVLDVSLSMGVAP